MKIRSRIHHSSQGLLPLPPQSCILKVEIWWQRVRSPRMVFPFLAADEDSNGVWFSAASKRFLFFFHSFHFFSFTLWNECCVSGLFKGNNLFLKKEEYSSRGPERNQEPYYFINSRHLFKREDYCGGCKEKIIDF